MVEIIVSGHMCLDLLPNVSSVPLDKMASPGKLFEVGPLDMSTGGAVSNTGLALRRLGVDVGLMGSVGDDIIGRIVIALFKDQEPALAEYIHVREGGTSSYTVLMSPQNSDRIIFHFAGTNESFSADDVETERVRNAKIFHLGYPPLLPGLLQDDGAPLIEIFRKVKGTGVITSLDTAMPDPLDFTGQVDWPRILAATLPLVDIFVPSVEELVFMLRRDLYDELDGNILPTLNRDLLESLTAELLEMGSAVVGLKLSSYGLYLRTTTDAGRFSSLAALSLSPADWLNKAVYRPAFEADRIVGTTGAGDAAYAGVLAAMLRGLPPQRVVTVANAAGALNVTHADATSGLLPWDDTLARIDAGWDTLSQFVPGFEEETNG